MRPLWSRLRGCLREVFERRFPKSERPKYDECVMCESAPESGEMGLAPGGRMRQEIYDDPFDPADWDLKRGNRCFVHIANSLVWRAITGANPPATPATAEEYTRAGLPWFDYLDDSLAAVDGTEVLKALKSVAEMGKEKGDVPLPENESVTAERVISIRAKLKKGQVREGRF